MSETQSESLVKAVVLDWAGTTIDHGSRAPASVFQQVFTQRGIDVTVAQAREPMGMAKRDHIKAIGTMNDVSRQWESAFGKPFGEADIDALYNEFLPLQESVIGDHCELIDGVAGAVAWCRDRGMKIGSTTGYTTHLMKIVSAAAAKQGYEPDSVLCADDAPVGRPAPYLLYESCKRLNVYPLWHVVKVDDTPVGIRAGRNAGCWTVGVTRTGNGVGLSKQEVASLDPSELQQRCAQAKSTLDQAGAHYTIESVADLPGIIEEIESRLRQGDTPL